MSDLERSMLESLCVKSFQMDFLFQMNYSPHRLLRFNLISDLSHY